MSEMNVLVVDDDKNICKLIESALRKNGFNVSSANSGEATLDILQKDKVDIIILDILLPGIDGLETLKQIRTNPSCEHIPVIMLTCKDTEFDNVIGLELGADDYLGKPIRFHELVARVKSVLRRSKKVTQDKQTIIKHNNLKINMLSRTAYFQNIPLALSYKEFELLTLLARNPGKVFTRDEILDTVWHEDYSYDTRTVDVHIRRLRKRFEEFGNSDNQIIETVRNVGYRYRKTT